MDIVAWSRMVAELAVDRLLTEGLVQPEDFDAALAATAEEIQVRLAMSDYPDIEGDGPIPVPQK